MKKLLLMTVMALALFSLLALSAFAEGIVNQRTDSDEYGTVIQLTEDPGLDNAAQYVSTLKKINDSGDSSADYCIVTDGTYYYVFPSSYVVDERADGIFDLYAGTDAKPGLAQAMAEFNAAMGTKYYDGYSIYSSGAGKRLNELVRFEFPSGVTKVKDNVCCLRSYPSLLEVRFNHEIDLNTGDLFKSSSKLISVDLEKAAPTLGKSMFIGCSSLEAVILPTDIVRISSSMFWGCRKVTITNLSECTQLTTIGSSAFQDTVKLVFTLPDTVTTIEASAFQSAFKEGGSFTINKTSQLTTIDNDAFRDCRTLPSIYIPSTVTSIGSGAFRQTHSLTNIENFENCQITVLKYDTFHSATQIKTLKLPKTLETIEAAFYGNEKLSLVYIPASVTSLADTFTGSQPANAVYVYTGKDASVFAGCARLSGANVISADAYDPAASYTGINLVMGYSTCIVYENGVHGEREVDTVVTSYLADIKVVSKCLVCGMMDENGKISALFACQGYSVPENGIGGIVIGYVVNRAAIEEYTSLSGKTITYGVFAVSQSKLGDNEIFDEDGNAANGVLTMNTSKYEFRAFTLKVTGITEETLNVKLALGAYVAITDEKGTVYSYMQDTTKGALVGDYYFASYNDIVG